MSPSRLVVVALSMGALVVVGCGKSSESEPAKASSNTATTEAKTQTTTAEAARTSQPAKAKIPAGGAALVAKAEAICKRLYDQHSRLTINSQQQLAQVGPSLTRSEQVAAVELSKLTAPASLAADWQQMVAASRTLAEDNARLVVYASEKKLETPQVAVLISSADALRRRVRAIAERDGFRYCAKFI